MQMSEGESEKTKEGIGEDARFLFRTRVASGVEAATTLKPLVQVHNQSGSKNNFLSLV